MSDSYDDYESKIQLAEHAWEEHVDEMVKTEHDKQIEIAQAYERGWNAALAQQEPVAWLDAEMSQAYTIDELPDASGTGFLPLYTAPPKKQWVGLTEEEREFLLHQALRFYDTNAQLLSFIKTVEEKLKDKNT